MPVDRNDKVFTYESKSKLTQIPYINKNFWVTIENESFACWKARFSQDTILPLERIIEFIREIHILGAYNDVCDIFGHDKLENLDYSTAIKKRLEEVTQLSIFDLTVPQSESGDFFYSVGVINYFDTFVRSRQIDDVGQLLRKLNPDKVQQFTTTYMVSAAPVSLKGFEIHKLEDGNVLINTNATIEISLMTDIWFPWVVGFMEETPAKQRETMYDNRQLAFRHTPRLNDYLQHLRTLTNWLGMTWELSHVHPLYQWMVNEGGIMLDVESRQ